MAKAWDHGGKTRQQRGYGKEHERIRAELLRDIVFCEECARRGRLPRIGEVADHIVPKAKGGGDERSNYQLLCREHAAEKDAADRGVKHRKKRTIGVSGWPVGEE